MTLRLAAKRIPAGGPLKVRVKNANGFAVDGKLSGRTTNRRVKLKAKSFRVAAESGKTVRLGLPKVLRRLLQRKGKLSLRLTLEVTGPAGNTRTVTKKVTPRLGVKRRR